MLYGIVLPLLLLVAPWVVVRFVLTTPASRQLSYRAALPYLASAAGVWLVAAAMPEFPLFGGATSTFALHAAGGVVAAILFWFVVRAYRLQFSWWWLEPLALFFFASTLGVVNELFEFGLHHAGYLADNGADTWWDLVANTLGAALAYLAVRAARLLRTSS